MQYLIQCGYTDFKIDMRSHSERWS